MNREGIAVVKVAEILGLEFRESNFIFLQMALYVLQRRGVKILPGRFSISGDEVKYAPINGEGQPYAIMKDAMYELGLGHTDYQRAEFLEIVTEGIERLKREIRSTGIENIVQKCRGEKSLVPVG